MVGNVVYVSGGNDYQRHEMSAILSWDPLQEKWTHVGDLTMARSRAGAVAVRSNAIDCATQCSK